ncbi:MAG: ATP-binding protein [Pseudomonadota bacterium]
MAHDAGDQVTSADDGSSVIAAEAVGESAGEISVEISTRFLEHFSEQLYSSPQKAFEELISNGWDAGATFVDVFVPDDLASPTAALTVFDNGASMDEDGLRTLWKIAFSPKEKQQFQYGRRVVGKFGIGKLSTYVLGNKLTYICKAADGVIRRVTMDYGAIDKSENPDKLVSELNLEMFELSEDELEEALASVENGPELKKLITKEVVPEVDEIDVPDEFGSPQTALETSSSDSWTLVVLSGLKRSGRNLQTGILRRMLEAALPMSSELTIRLNGDVLQSSKVDATVIRSWKIGEELGFKSFEVAGPIEGETETITFKTESEEENEVSYTFVDIPEIGKVSGTITLYEDKISGGKSEEIGFSNGFLVNVLGRVVNQDDPQFGADNHSHASWARFRMAVRADGLNHHLVTNREQFKSSRELKVFRAFLRRCFNLTRSVYDSDANAEMPDGGDVLVKSLGVVSLAPLRSAVSEALRTQPQLPGLFDDSGITDREESRKNWRENTSDNIKNALESVKYETFKDDEFVKFRLSDSTIVVNKKHPFVAEHSRTKAEKELMRTVAMVNFLTDVYALETGVDPSKLDNVRQYRDRLMRFRAIQRRQSGTHIAQILLQKQHKSGVFKEMEAVLADALRYIGFSVETKGGSGEPEGVASAKLFATSRKPTDAEPEPPLYKFTYDAKSSKHDAAKTGNLSLDGIKEHKKRYDADYALVVAPGFQDGAAATRCEQQGVTPIKASDLGRLLEFTVKHGAIPLDRLEGLFKLHDPDKVTEWIDALQDELTSSRKLTLDVFLKALEQLRGKVPDVLDAGTISFTCRETLNAKSVTDSDVLNLVRGVSILVPDLVGLTEDQKIVVNAAPNRVADAVKSQLEELHGQDETEGDGD